MYASSGRGAFSLPPYTTTDRPRGDHRVLPFASAWSQPPQQRCSSQLRAFGNNGSSGSTISSSSSEGGSSSNRDGAWECIPHRSRQSLAERRRRSLWSQQQQQQRVYGKSLPEDGNGEAVDAGRADDVPRQQPSRPSHERRPRALRASPPTDRVPSGGDEGMVILDDLFDELDGSRPRYSCVVHDALAAGPTPYNDGWEWQKKALARLAERPNDLSSNEAEPDRVLMTQHDAVFTLGTGSTLDNLRFDPGGAPFGEVVRTERGGEVTYHGPGQIVLYPILNLRRYRQDIHWYLRALEETVIRTLAKLDLKGDRLKGLTGVWVDGRKVAAVGVRVKRWVTMHGLSLNVCPNLEHFKHIVPCGIDDRPVGSLEQLCGRGEDVSLDRVGRLLLESFEEVFGVAAVLEPLPLGSPSPTAPPLKIPEERDA